MNKPHVTHNSGNNEWYTPAPIIEAARQVMLEIDLDPASCTLANQTVRATECYTAEINGLLQDWRGRVWLNPPYSRDLCGAFIDKLLQERRDLRVTDACLLTNNATDTQWWQAAARQASAICFLYKRVKFYKPGSASASPLQGQTVMFFTRNQLALCRFNSEFRNLGMVMEHYR